MTSFRDDDHPAIRAALAAPAPQRTALHGAQVKIPAKHRKTRRSQHSASGDKSPKKAGSTLERAFDTHWRQFAPPSMPAPVAELRALPPRRWRFDRSWPDLRVAVELHGGTWNGGRHSRGAGFSADCEKQNAAQADGWLVLAFTSDMLRDDPEGCIALVVDVLETRQRQQAMPRGAAAPDGDDEAGT